MGVKSHFLLRLGNQPNRQAMKEICPVMFLCSPRASVLANHIHTLISCKVFHAVANEKKPIPVSPAV